ncbi:MAG: SDR family NAD(P)-dependent oxidoreductase, partial [Janthinobacterium lividum]
MPERRVAGRGVVGRGENPVTRLLGSDPYGAFVRTGAGAAIVRSLGLPKPSGLRRFVSGQDLLPGPAVVLGFADASHVGPVTSWLHGAGARVLGDLAAVGEERLGALVVDAASLRTVDELGALREWVAPAFKRMTGSGRVLVLGAVPAQVADLEGRAVQRSLEGLVRTLGKEARGGTTVNLLRVADGAGDALRSAVEFFSSARSAFVSGQPLTITPAPPQQQPTRPREARVAVVTGAAQGIGAAVAEVLARSGTHVVCVDVTASGDRLAKVANGVRGSTLHLDVTAPDAP